MDDFTNDINDDLEENTKPKPAKKYNKISDYKKYSTNPFIDKPNGLMINTRRKTVAYGSSALAVVNRFSGEITDDSTMVARFSKQVDQENFIKLYLSMIREMMFLPSNAMKVLAYLMTALKINNDMIMFDREECMKFTGLSDARIYDGLSKLLENKIIARRTNPYQYYINPNAFFNGDRLIIIREFYKKPRPKDDYPDQIDLFQDDNQLSDNNEGDNNEL